MAAYRLIITLRFPTRLRWRLDEIEDGAAEVVFSFPFLDINVTWRVLVYSS